MTLSELIERLEKADPKTVVRNGFSTAHSYRGYYEDLAFEPDTYVTVEHMLTCAKAALGKTYCGWKGGEFRMHEYTTVWVAEHGRTGEAIGPRLLSYMLNDTEES